MNGKTPRRFELSEGSSDKFWEVATSGTELTTRWGRIGTDGQSKAKEFDTAELAEAAAARLVNRKLEEGYTEPGWPRLKPRKDRPIDPKVAAAVRAAWGRIDRWLAGHAPQLVGKLGKPATQAAIEKAEAAMGVELPDDVRASYMIHDGLDFYGLFTYGSYVPLKVMLREHKFWRDHLESDEYYPDFDIGHPKGPIRNVWFHIRWVPLTDTGSGDHILIDLAPARGGKVGQVIQFSHEEGPTDILAPSLAKYLSDIAKSLESGEAVFFNHASVRGDGPARVEQWVTWPSDDDPQSYEKNVAKEVKATVTRYFERVAGSSRKFWEVFQKGPQVIINRGRIGSEGSPSLELYKDEKEADVAVTTAIAKKLKQGYVERKIAGSSSGT